MPSIRGVTSRFGHVRPGGLGTVGRTCARSSRYAHEHALAEHDERAVGQSQAPEPTEDCAKAEWRNTLSVTGIAFRRTHGAPPFSLQLLGFEGTGGSPSWRRSCVSGPGAWDSTALAPSGSVETRRRAFPRASCSGSERAAWTVASERTQSRKSSRRQRTMRCPNWTGAGSEGRF